MGSRATEDRRVMKDVLQALPSGMYFVDSRTTGSSVAAPLARAMGIRSAARNVFLDDVASEPAVRKQLAELARTAAARGVAVGIGHMYPETVRVLVADAPTMRGSRLDVLGVALVGPGVSAAVLGLSWIEREHSVMAGPVLVPLALAVLLLGGYAWHALRREAPLVDLRLLATPGLAASLLTAGTNGLATFGALFLIPLYFQQVHGVGPAVAGLLLAPLGAASMIAMPVSGRLSDRLGARRVALAGGVIALAGAVLLAVQPGTGGFATTVLGALVIGLGLGAVGAPAIGSVFRTVPPESASQGSALLYMVNQLGAAIGIAVAALLVATAGAFGPAFWLLAAGVTVGLMASTALPGPARSQPHSRSGASPSGVAVPK
jgi:hypothetical protein